MTHPLSHRAAALHRLATEEFDLCIIGGGASGVGCALDAALRGLKVALVERDDFAAGTSSRSTKLVHGGVRYLEQAFKKGDFAQLRQVQHGLRERHRVLTNAPHLARPLALLTPVFSWWEGLYFSIGLKLYDWFASGKNQLPRSRWLSRAEALRRMPGLNPRIHSAVLYYDGQLDDARYCLALALSAAEVGAVVLNHVEVADFQKDESGRIITAHFRDRLEQEARGKEQRAKSKGQEASTTQQLSNSFIRRSLGEGGTTQQFPSLRARQFLNCTGPFADHIRLLANPALAPRIRPSKGVHAVLPHATLGSEDAILIPKTADGRMVFAIPFQGRVLLGTTDEDYPDPEPEPLLEAREVDFLLQTLNPFLTQPVPKEAVSAGFGGLRPLVSTPPPTPLRRGGRGDETRTRHAHGSEHALSPLSFWRGAGGEATRSLLRDHEVEHDPASHLLSLLGGKWTTYRLMAQDAVDAVCRRLGIRAECRTGDHRLVGAEGYGTSFWQKIQREHGCPDDVAQHLAQQYGTQAAEVAALFTENPAWREPLAADFPFLKAEVVYAVRHEMALTLRDVLSRRIRLEILDWAAAAAAAPMVASLMAAELGWTQEQMERAAAEYVERLGEWRRAARA